MVRFTREAIRPGIVIVAHQAPEICKLVAGQISMWGVPGQSICW